MPVTREFAQTIKDRAARDPEFRRGLLEEALQAFFEDDLETGKIILRDYINATIGFESLGEDLGKNPKSLMRMLSPQGNPRTDNFFSMVSHLNKHEGISVRVGL